ncbi:nitroreductase family protein [uncultured Microbacterium sp.]|uniref:nitroreductase family protein n=1 Tax=uncultured Microbacterium sp. TaxID=191216 RepID=UPI0035C98DC1
MSDTALLSTTDRRAATDSPLLGVLADRWSPRGFDADASIDEVKLASALEAARWSPSANNSQPWRFIVARRGTGEFDSIVLNLRGFNREWAERAGALVVAVAETETADGTPVHFAAYDLGQAMAHFSVQAHHDGLHVHQMGGIEREGLSAAFGLESRFVPLTVTAVGTLGGVESLSDAVQERESAPRVRRPLAESVVLSA